MQRYRVSKGWADGTMDMNDAAVAAHRAKGYQVDLLGPSTVILCDDNGAPLDWEQVGRVAYLNGEASAPALNIHVQAAIAGLSVGGGAADIMRAFAKGWTAENLAAGVS
jgi:hypothetical protein